MFDAFYNRLIDTVVLFATKIFVSAKRSIMETGCEHVEEIIALAKSTWDKLAGSIDIPLMDAATEKKFKDDLWQRMDKGIRAFSNQVCNPDNEKFGAPQEELFALADDHTLPDLS